MSIRAFEALLEQNADLSQTGAACWYRQTIKDFQFFSGYPYEHCMNIVDAIIERGFKVGKATDFVRKIISTKDKLSAREVLDLVNTGRILPEWDC